MLRYKTSVVIDGNSEAVLSHAHVFEAGINYLLDLTVISYVVQEVWQSSGQWALLCQPGVAHRMLLGSHLQSEVLKFHSVMCSTWRLKSSGNPELHDDFRNFSSPYVCCFTVVNLRAKCQQHVSGFYLMMWKSALLFSWAVCAKQCVLWLYVLWKSSFPSSSFCVSRWGQMASAEWDCNSSSPWLWWCRPWALFLPDGTVLTGTHHTPQVSHVPSTALAVSALGTLLQKYKMGIPGARATMCSKEAVQI